MTNDLLAATGRPSKLVNRQIELEKIRQAIFRQDKTCQIVLIKGEGGLGKTRLLEEVMRRLGHPDMVKRYGQPTPTEEEDWSSPEVAFTDLIDFVDIRLHVREYFLEKLGQAATWRDRVEWKEHEARRAEQRRLADWGAGFVTLQKASQEAERAFWQDYRAVAAQRRLLILLDTTEQLSVTSSQWLLEHDLLRPQDLLSGTQQWLLQQIREGRFTNATILIVGRIDDDFQKGYFQAIEEACGQTPECSVTPLLLEPFKEEETRQFFEVLHEDWRSQSGDLAQNVRALLDDLLTEKKQLETLQLYTKGQPVLLSLYADLLLEGLVPTLNLEAERDQRTPFEAAAQRMAAEFINLLFGQTGTLRADILQILVRAARGLTAEDIHFVLDSKPGEEKEWQSDPAKVARIEQEMDELRKLSIVKPKEGKSIGLRDEIYNLYADFMAADPQSHQKEMEARNRLYGRLSKHAELERERLQKERTGYVKEVLERTSISGRPSEVLATRLPKRKEVEEEELRVVEAELVHNELEYLHYALLTDPQHHFNQTYYNLANQQDRAFNEARVVMLQAEMWRALHDDFAFKFIELEKDPRHGEDPVLALRRAAQQDDAAKWILRLVLRGEYNEAVALADRIQEKVDTLPAGRERESWNHTFARGERGCWREYANVYRGRAHRAVPRLEEIGRKLRDLEQADTGKEVFPGEHGFRGHYAYPRLVFVIAGVYNALGYGHTTLGNYHQGVRAYGVAVKYLRQLRLQAQQAETRNNLSRALVEVGKKRAIRICEDGLRLRIQLGDWLPIAYSYNTLGLIYNNLYRPREALEACAKALAIVQSVGDPRALGLVLHQVGEALRRLASSGEIAPDETKETFYREADKALQEARDIFVESAARRESLRLVETYLEWGCLYRDWMGNTDKARLPQRWEARYKQALNFLQQAITDAGKLQLTHLQLDAQVNLAWTHYQARQYAEARQALQAAEALANEVDEGARLMEGRKPPRPREHTGYLFQQLSKMYGLRGRMAFDQFTERKEELKLRCKDDKERRKFIEHDPDMRTLLAEAADSYTQALAYVQLFAPHSAPLIVLYDHLYNYLKTLYVTEMNYFYQCEEEARKKYRPDLIELVNFGELEGWLRDSFGDYYEPDTA